MSNSDKVISFLQDNENNDKDNNFVSAEVTDFGLIQYSHDYDFCVFSKKWSVKEKSSERVRGFFQWGYN